MNNMEYLNQITASTKPVKPASMSSFKSMIIKIIIAAVGLLVVIIIFGILLGNLVGKEKSLSEQLVLRTANLSKAISTYNKEVKSSSLRSLGTSLVGILDSTNRDVTKYLTEQYQFEVSKVDQKLQEDETAVNAQLTTNLETAKLNGLLDRTYAYQAEYQISLVLSIESEILSRTKDEALLQPVSNSYRNLKNLKDRFEERTKN